MKPNRRLVLTLAAVVAAGVPVLAAQDVPWEFEGASRIVAVGDVHGAYDRFVANLQATGLVDKDLKWAGGTAHLVQTGDLLDRGPDSRKVMDLLMALEPQAEAAGGRVHALIGNHEFWNVVGELSYVSMEEFRAFDGARDRELKTERGSAAAVPGFFAHREAFGPEGPYGRWIRGHNAAVKINGIVFLHGGITPETAALGLGEVNRRVRAELDAPADVWQRGLALTDSGPLMTRRYSDENLTAEDESRLAPEFESVLATLGAKAMVMGHTVTFGLITPRFGRKAVLIDTGMLDLYLGGHQGALAIEGDKFYAVHAKGRAEIPESLDGEAGARYIEAVVAAAPGDSALLQKLASVRVRQGRLKDAADLFKKVGVEDPRSRLPYTWRREAAECFDALGDRGRAEKLYTMYLDAFGTYAERMGAAGLPMLHMFARECLRLGLMKEEALVAARRVATASGLHLQHQVTLGWAYLEQGDAARAVEVLTAAIDRGGDGFEAQFQLARALENLDQHERAAEAFRAALSHQPGNRDAEAGLARLTGKAKTKD
jgi:tetratricopeptide (TPR) repeat protein